jgi:uncharacterized membrane protein YbhN (UPF0104 family)
VKLDLLKWGKGIWVVGVGGVAAVYVAQHFPELSESFRAVPPFQIALSFGFLMAGKLLLVVLSQRSIPLTDWSPGFIEMFRISSVTQLAKYLPGGVWHLVGRMGVYKAKRLSVKQGGKAVFVENLWLATAALGTGLVLFLPDHFQNRLPRAAVVSLVLVIAIGWVLANWIIDRYRKELHAKGSTNALTLTAIQFGAWVLLGLSFWVLFPQPGETIAAPAAIGAFGLAWVVGFAAIFAPGGLAVRELMLGSLLSGILSMNLVVLLAVVHRALWVLIEVIFGTISAFGSDVDLEALKGQDGLC